MTRRNILSACMIGFVVLWLASGLWADAIILNVPDWNQPANYGVNGYPNWCSPTAGANIMGYWEDVKGCTGLTDRQAFPNSPAYPNTAGTWKQGLYHDGTIEMGWWMDTGNWRSNGGPFPPNAGGTNLGKIAIGLLGYANSAYNDPGTGIVKVAYPNTQVTTQNSGNTPLAMMWPVYTAAIDAGEPVECSFDHWVDSTAPPEYAIVDGQTVEKYPWDFSSDPHSVVGVGYIDPVPGYNGDGTEFFICQDNWPTTGRFVAVPVDYVWLQNDYISNVPEPLTLTLLVMGSASLLLGRKKRN